MKLKKLSFLAAGIAAAVFNAFPVQASSVINAVPQVIQAESSVTADNTVTYFGSEVLEAYTYNPQKYTYHKISDSKQLSLLIKLLESGKTKSPKAETEGGFLLVTANGRHEIYIDSQEQELLTLCQNNNSAEPGLVQWLVFMNPEKITKVNYTYWTEKETWGVYTDEQWALSEISSLLKSLKVDKTQKVTTNPEDHKNPPMGGEPIFLTFNTGVRYRIDFGDIGEPYLSIRSSDMNYSISYSLQKGECDRLLQCLKQIEGKNPTRILSLPVELKPEEIASVTALGSLGDSSFSIDTAEPQKIKKICDILRTMRVYGMEHKTDIICFKIPDGNGFQIHVKNKDGSAWFFDDYIENLYIFNNFSSPNKLNYMLYGYKFTQEDFADFYNALNSI